MLAGLRADIETVAGPDLHFWLKVLGGRWTARHIGVPADRVATFARSGDARAFCRRFDMPSMSSFSFRKFGEANAVETCRGVQRKLLYFFMIWMEADDPEFRFSDAQLFSYLPSDQFSAILLGVQHLPPRSPVRVRLTQVDKLCPTNPL